MPFQVASTIEAREIQMIYVVSPHTAIKHR